MSGLKKLDLIASDVPESVSEAMSRASLAGQKLEALGKKTVGMKLQGWSILVSSFLLWGGWTYSTWSHYPGLVFTLTIAFQFLFGMMMLIIFGVMTSQHRGEVWDKPDDRAENYKPFFFVLAILITAVCFPLEFLGLIAMKRQMRRISREVFEGVLGDPRADFLRNLDEQIKAWNVMAFRVNRLTSIRNHGLVDLRDVEQTVPFDQIERAREQLVRQIACAEEILRDGGEIGTQEFANIADPDYDDLVAAMDRAQAELEETAGRAIAGFEAQQALASVTGPAADIKRAMQPDLAGPR